MLKPAMKYKDILLSKFTEVMYDPDCFYYMGYAHGHELPKIEPCDNVYQWAIVNRNDDVIGWFAYRVDPANDSVYNFGLYSFDKGNYIVGKDVFEKLEELVKTYKRIEWRVIEGNPVIRSYDKFCEKHNGHKAILHQVTKDLNGIYRDEYIYEIIKQTRYIESIDALVKAVGDMDMSEMSREKELKEIKRKAFMEGVSSVWGDIARVTPRKGDYNCLYNAIHGIGKYPNGFKVNIEAIHED